MLQFGRPVGEDAFRDSAAGVVRMVGDEPFEVSDVRVRFELFEFDHFRVAVGFELNVRVVDVGDAAAHTGRNFAAGMSGGIAYVYDPQVQLKANCNPEMVELEKLEVEADIADLKRLITNHANYTGSGVAKRILANWSTELKHFLKVMPVDYKRALAEMAKETSTKSGKVIATAAGQV